jgi:hypothetical protein
MIIKNFTRFAVIFIVSTLGFAQHQNRYSASVVLTSFSYGMEAQLWNPTDHTIYLDSADASAYPLAAYSPTDGVTEFGWGASNLEEQNCQAVVANPLTTDLPAQARVTMQPCSPNGLPYLDPSTGYTNYTHTNYANLARAYGETTSLRGPIAIQPNHGVTLYFAFWRPGVYWLPWLGYQSVNFYWCE